MYLNSMNFISFRSLFRKIKAARLWLAAGCLMALCGDALAATITNSTGLSITLDTSGNYTVQSSAPAWTFGGSLGATPTSVATNSNADNIGVYSEITFNFVNGVSRTAAIRLYSNAPVVLFTHTYLTASANNLAFPKLTTLPTGLNFVNYQDAAFFTYDFGALHGDSPWLFFDTNYNSFVISPAANFMIASDSMSGGAISCGINSGITNLPANFTHRTILVIQNGINRTFDTWGNALTGLSGKVRPANDAAVELNKLGYWTDNGATYYYNYVSNSYPATLLAVRNEFAGKGLNLGYMQLDSWWYPKGAADTWQGSGNQRGGIYQYIAAPELFTNGLASFQQQLGLPLITHSRWIDPASPYNSQYLMSTNTSGTMVSVDPAYWTNRMAYLQSGGVVTYEQDWLSQMALPALNLNDPPAFMNDMASAANSYAINMQYCMALPRHILQGSLYNNLLTTRASDDTFVPARWDQFIYDSRFASALGTWPWTDVYFSSAIRSLLIGTLSAGPVGVGDALGTVSAANLSKSVRADSVIVKPDVPLVPLDFNYVNDAQGRNLPLVSSTYTDHNGFREYYVFAYARTSANPNASFTPAQLGMSSNAYVYDYFNETGIVVTAGNSFNFTTTTPDAITGGSYFIVSPIGPSGIAFVGDVNKFVTAGKKRISVLSDSGSLQVTVAFAAGENDVTLLGYSPLYAPQVTVSNGSTGPVSYNNSRQFTVSVSPDGSGTAAIVLNVVSNNLPQVTTPTISPQETVAVGSGTVVTVAETLLPPLNNPPFTYQWQSNNLNIGSASTTSSASNSFSMDTTGFAAGSYNYNVIVSNAIGSVTSAPVTLTVVSPTNLTLNFGGAPVVQPTGDDWNTPDDWSDGNPADVSASSNPYNTYEVVIGSRLRTPAGTTSNVFPGAQLTVDGSGVFENDGGGNPVNVGEIRFKGNTSPTTNYFNNLVLNGGQLDNGGKDNITSILMVIQGQMNIAQNSAIYIDNTASSIDRGFQIDSWLTGSGNLLWHQFDGVLGSVDLQITGTSNKFNGQWIVDQGALVGVGAGSLGTNNIIVGTNGLNAAVETLYDINNPKGSLIIGANGRTYLHQNDTFKSVNVNGTSLTNGTYSFATLNSAYPIQFPSSWTQQAGSTFTTGSGSITVLTNPGPIIVSQPQSISLYVGQGSATFSVTAGGTSPFGYQWFTNGTVALSDNANRMGSTSNVLTIPNPTVADSGNYTVVVTNISGAVTSSVAVLTVLPQPTTIAVVDNELAQSSISSGVLRLATNLTVSASANTLLVVATHRNGGNAPDAPPTLSWTNGTFTDTLTKAIEGDSQSTSGGRCVTIYYCYNPHSGSGFNIKSGVLNSASSSGALVAYTLSGVDTTVTPLSNAQGSQSTANPGSLHFGIAGIAANSWAAVGSAINNNGETTDTITAYTNTGATTGVTTLFTTTNGFSGGLCTAAMGYISSIVGGSDNFTNSYSGAPPSNEEFVGAIFSVPPLPPRITAISLSGTLLSISAANGLAGGSWTLLQSTNVALPLNQWQTNCTGNFDGGGNLSTNIANTATNRQEFYILKVQ